MAFSLSGRSRALGVTTALMACYLLMATASARQLQGDDGKKQQQLQEQEQQLQCSVAVSPVLPVGICTADVNPCGHSSSCQCPPGFEYDQRLGPQAGCLKKDAFSGFLTGPSLIQGNADALAGGDCALEIEEVACTKDITPCGHPSRCLCPETYQYSPVAGKCLKVGSNQAKAKSENNDEQCAVSVAPTGFCTYDLNPCGFPSACQCPEGFVYDQRLGPAAGCLKEGVFPEFPMRPVGTEETNLTECALDIAEDAACTKDLTPCGGAGLCKCPQGFDYSPLAQKCLKAGF